MRLHAFTLIELLVVIAIIAILAAILFPVFAQAKAKAKHVANLSNLRQVSVAVHLYNTDNEAYPLHSSPSSQSPRTRWPDHLFPYHKSEKVFDSPLAPTELRRNRWAHNPDLLYGGYGFNYQYLGNARFPFSASDSMVGSPSQTLAVSDTAGVRNDEGFVTAGVYVVDPPLPSLRGSGRPSGFYGIDTECGSASDGCRSKPGGWHAGRCVVAFADGHAKALALSSIDDFDMDGTQDNGWFNGNGDPHLR